MDTYTFAVERSVAVIRPGLTLRRGVLPLGEATRVWLEEVPVEGFASLASDRGPVLRAGISTGTPTILIPDDSVTDWVLLRIKTRASGKNDFVGYSETFDGWAWVVAAGYDAYDRAGIHTYSDVLVVLDSTSLLRVRAGGRVFAIWLDASGPQAWPWATLNASRDGKLASPAVEERRWPLITEAAVEEFGTMLPNEFPRAALASYPGLFLVRGRDAVQRYVPEHQSVVLPEVLSRSRVICDDWAYPVADGQLELLYLTKLIELRLRWRRWRHGEIERLTREGVLSAKDVKNIEAETRTLHEVK